MTRNVRLFAVLALLNCIWTPVNIAVRIARNSGFSPVGIGLCRWLGVAILLAILVRVPFVAQRLKLVHPTRKDALLALGLGLVLTGPAHLCYYVALQHTEVLEGNVFNTTSPLWTALLAGILLHERVDGRRWLSLVLGMVGAYVTAVGFALPSLQQGHVAWNGLYMLGTMLESATGVLLAALIRRSSGLTVLGVEAIGMAGAMALASIIFPAAAPLHVPVGGVGWLWLVYLVSVAGVLAFGWWATLLETAPISLMVISTVLQIPLGAGLGYLAFGERVGLNTAIGAGLVGLALVVVVTEGSRRRRVAPGA